MIYIGVFFRKRLSYGLCLIVKVNVNIDVIFFKFLIEMFKKGPIGPFLK